VLIVNERLAALARSSFLMWLAFRLTKPALKMKSAGAKPMGLAHLPEVDVLV